MHARPQNRPPAWPVTAPRWRAAGVLLLGVVLLHVLLLGGLGSGAGTAVERPATTAWRAVTVRQLMAPTPTPTPTSTPMLAPAPAPPARAARTEVLALASAVQPAAAPLKEPSGRADPESADRTDATDPSELPPAIDAPDTAGLPVPTYRTQLPPPVTLQYTLQRSAASGAAVLDWRPAGTRYQLTLQSRLAGGAPRAAPLVGWVSQGSFDADGIAPERYVESRRGREQRAANFERQQARIRFSGPAVEHPLQPGVQDRLSWMLQLAGVMAADPALAAPGSRVSMWVVGTRGDHEVWTFAVQGFEDIDLPGGAVTRALHLRREAPGPYRTEADLWLDPARHHLPVQTLLRLRAGGDALELRLQGLQPAPP